MKNTYHLKLYFPLVVPDTLLFCSLRCQIKLVERKKSDFDHSECQPEHFYCRKSVYAAMMSPSHWHKRSGAAVIYSDETQMVSAEPAFSFPPERYINQLHFPAAFFQKDHPLKCSSSLSLTHVQTTDVTSWANRPMIKEDFNRTMQWLNLLLKLGVLSYIYFALENKKICSCYKKIRKYRIELWHKIIHL